MGKKGFLATIIAVAIGAVSIIFAEKYDSVDLANATYMYMSNLSGEATGNATGDAGYVSGNATGEAGYVSGNATGVESVTTTQDNTGDDSNHDRNGDELYLDEVSISNPRISVDGIVTWDIVEFGNYYQSNDTDKEPIEWRVLYVDGNDIFMIADKALDYRQYSDTCTDVTWENSTIRKWLNDNIDPESFINTAFSEFERNAIKETLNTDCSNKGDKIFLLSYDEASNSEYGFDAKAYKDSATRVASATEYAVSKGVYIKNDTEYGESCCWTLRSQNFDSSAAGFVGRTGYCDFLGGIPSSHYDDYGAIRPALHIDISKVALIAHETRSEKIENVDSGLRVMQSTYDYSVVKGDSLIIEPDIRIKEQFRDGLSYSWEKYIIDKNVDGWYVHWGECTEKVDGSKLYIDNIKEDEKYKVTIKDNFGNSVKIQYNINVSNENAGYVSGNATGDAGYVSGNATGDAGYVSGNATGDACYVSGDAVGGDSVTPTHDNSSENEIPTPVCLSREVTFRSDKGYISGQADNTEIKYTTNLGNKISDISEIKFSGVWACYPNYIRMSDDKYEGYVFKGWETEGDDNVYNFTGDSAIYTFFEFSKESNENIDVNTDYIITDDVTFEAVWEWEELYRVTFELERDGEWYSAWVRCKNNELLNNYAIPRNNNYVNDNRIFKGWKIEGDNTLYVTDKNNVAENEKYIGDYVVTGPVTFTAIWEYDDTDTDDTEEVSYNYNYSNLEWSDEGNYNWYYAWRLNDDGTASIKPYINSFSVDIVIPDKVVNNGNEYLVSTVEKCQFEEMYDASNNLIEWSDPVYLYIPNTVKVIDENAFEGRKSNIVLCGINGSFSEQYAKENNIGFVAGENIKDIKQAIEESKINKIKDSIVVSDKVLNICVWNDEFPRRLEKYYPGYVANDKEDASKGGRIGDVSVNYIVIPSDDNKFQRTLDEIIDKVDMFMIESDYALKYVETDKVLPISEMGITDDELSKQFQYTKDIGTDSEGVLKSVTWQVCPGALIYNRNAAKQVLGTDDPAIVQLTVADWDKYAETAEKIHNAGYKMTATAADTYRVFSNNVSSAWSTGDGQDVNIDSNIEKWAAMMKEQVDKGITETGELWGENWKNGFYLDGKVFCYFAPEWFVDYCMAADDSESIAANSGWAACEGPQGFYWGGTWLCAGKNTDNKELIADIIRKLTTDDKIMASIAKESGDLVNNMTVLDSMADDVSLTDNILGGQNAIGIYSANAKRIRMNHCTCYDNLYSNVFQSAMNEYFNGNLATYEEAVGLFEERLSEKMSNVIEEIPTHEKPIQDPIIAPEPNDPSTTPINQDDGKSGYNDSNRNSDDNRYSGNKGGNNIDNAIGVDNDTNNAGDNSFSKSDNSEIHTGVSIGEEATDSGSNYIVNSEDTVIYEDSLDTTVTTVIIPDTVILNGKEYKVTEISNSAFSKNNKLRKITIGSNIEIIGKNAFAGCSNLTTVNVKGSSLKEIETGAFENCKKLTKITLGKNITKIGKNAFSGDKKLKTVTIKSTKINTIGKKAFKNINKNAIIYVPKSLSKKQLAKYKKLIKKAGAPKTIKIKKK